MSNEITMPKLSDTMEEGKILRWLKRPGDQIHRGDAIAEVETDKADMIMEAFDDGVIRELKLQEGESAPVGAVIALISPAGEGTEAGPPSDGAAEPAETASPEAAKEESQAQSAEVVRPSPRPQRRRREGGAEIRAAEPRPVRPREGESRSNRMRAVEPHEDNEAEYSTDEAAQAAGNGHDEDAIPQIHPAMSANPSAAPTAIAAPPRHEIAVATIPLPSTATRGEPGKLRASPLARRAAEEAGIDLTQIHGTGPDGRVTKRDVDNFLREQQLFRFRRLVAPREGLPGTREELTKMRKTIAHRMAQSKREIPHFYVTVEVDMEEAVKFKSSLEATELFEEDISYNDIVIKATALALSRYTRMNASYQDEGIAIFPNINIGMAVAVEDGLIVPVIKQCERLSLPEISRAAHRLVNKAARGGFTADEMSGATFTISNMGMLGVEHFAAVIIPPQAAILAVSAIKDRPVVRNGQLAVGKTMMMTVACDHRIIDGVIGARFLNEIKRFLENPASLLV
jgi:pyruvate dehydrogenase E2 component (dihydrolipoamide acetyltransferase)